jgi:hypothetical protein
VELSLAWFERFAWVFVCMAKLPASAPASALTACHRTGLFSRRVNKALTMLTARQSQQILQRCLSDNDPEISMEIKS